MKLAVTVCGRGGGNGDLGARVHAHDGCPVRNARAENSFADEKSGRVGIDPGNLVTSTRSCCRKRNRCKGNQAGSGTG